MGKNAKLKQQRKSLKIRQKHQPNSNNVALRPPIPTAQEIKYWLNHPATFKWLVGEWNKLTEFSLSVPQAQAYPVAKLMLPSLVQQTLSNLNQDLTIRYEIPNFELHVGLNVWDWTLWTSVHDKNSKFTIFSDNLACF